MLDMLIINLENQGTYIYMCVCLCVCVIVTFLRDILMELMMNFFIEPEYEN